MNNIEEKIKNEIRKFTGSIPGYGEIHEDKFCKRIMAIVESPQPSDEEMERMAEKALMRKGKMLIDEYDTGLTCIQFWIDGFKSGLSYRSKEEWVSISDRLPDVNVEVLALVRYKGGKSKHIITYRTGQGDWDSFLSESITHWQLLPPTDLLTTKQKEG